MSQGCLNILPSWYEKGLFCTEKGKVTVDDLLLGNKTMSVEMFTDWFPDKTF